MGTALNIKPMLEIRDGKIEAVEASFPQKAITRMLDLVVKQVEVPGASAPSTRCAMMSAWK